MFIAPFTSVPVPALIFTDPPVEVLAVVDPAVKFKFPPVTARVEDAGLTVILVPPRRVVISAGLFPAKEITPSSDTFRVDAPPDCRSISVPI